MKRLAKRSGRGSAALVAALSCVAVLALSPSIAGAAGGTAIGSGYNYSGQVGNGEAEVKGPDDCYCVITPAALQGVDNVTGLAAGYEFGLALRGDGSVWSWGYNYEGELGDGTTDLDPVPRPIEGISNAIAVAAGSAHALALLADGTVLAWGGNTQSKLGLGATTGPETCHALPCSTRPVPVPGLSGVIAIAAASQSSYALLADGTVLGWGADDYGAMGTGSAAENECKCVATPTPIPGVSGAIAISGGRDNGAALLRDGSVLNWGRNDLGQLGTGEVSPESGCRCLGVVSPTGVVGVHQISEGGHNTLLLSGPLARSWGYNLSGQLGLGTFSAAPCLCISTPTTIGALANVRKVDAGEDHGTALLANGALMAWGDNNYGQIGDGTQDEDRPSPVAVPAVSGASDVVASDYNTFSIIGPSQTLGVDFAGTGSGTVGGSGILCAKACSQPFAQGQVKALRADPDVAGQFAGWSGGGCAGTGPCFARLDTDQTVTATFGKPTGTRITKAKLSGKKKKKARFRFTAPGAVTGFQCLLVKPKARKGGAKKSPKKKKARFGKCAPGKTYKNLRPGKYTFKVRAVNILGVDAKPAKRKFKVRPAKR